MKILKPTLLALVCAFLLAMTNRHAHETIESNQRYYQERILRDLVGGAELIKTSLGYDVFRGGKLLGNIQLATTIKGYNGQIELLVAVTEAGEVINVRVIRHNETPGIGDKIDYQVSDWIGQFTGRSVNNTRWSLAPGGDIDAVSGATITSRAVTDAIHQVLNP